MIGVELALDVDPPMWLVFGREWAGSSEDLFAECAAAVAPTQIPLALLSRPARDVVQLSVALGRKLARRTVFLSDITAFLDEQGTSWAGLNIDWMAAADEITQAPVPTLYLSLSHRAYVILCWGGRSRLRLYTPGDRSGEDVAVSEREAVRAAITDTLVHDWPPYAQRLFAEHLARGTLRHA